MEIAVGSAPDNVARRKLAARVTHSDDDWRDELDYRRRTRTAG